MGMATVTTTQAVESMSADALRSYVRALRQGQGVSQKELAEHLGLTLRAFSGWEVGDTEDIKGTLLIRAIAYLKGSFEYLGKLTEDATPEDGERLAAAWIEELRLQSQTMTDDELDATIVALRRLRDNPQLLQKARAYADGLADARPVPSPKRPARRKWFQRRSAELPGDE